MGRDLTGTLSASETARMLKIETRTLQQMVRRGMVRPSKKSSKKTLRFDLSEIAAATRLRNGPTDLNQVFVVAQRALAMAEAAERKLEQLYSIFGIGQAPLPTDEESVISLYLQAERLLKAKTVELAYEEVLQWARTFNAITEAYLRLLEDLTADPMAWKLLLDLANELCAQAPLALFRHHKEIESAYGFLQAGRRNLTACAFFFVRNRHGQHIACELFPDGRQSIDDAVLELLPG